MAVQAQFPLCGSQDWIDNGCGVGLNQFCYSYLQQEQQQLQQQQCNIQMVQNQLQKNQNLCFDNTLLGSSAMKITNLHPSMAYSQGIVAYEEKQRQELDRYIRLQNERLRLLLQEQTKQQLASLIKKIESKALVLLRQKDEEIARATKRTAELEDFMKRLEMENQVWQRVAQENEAMAISLDNTIEQLREKASCCFANAAEDAESCCDVNRTEEEEEEEEAEKTEQKKRRIVGGNVTEEERARKKRKTMMVCKGCNSRNLCILFLPCRHLCACKSCESFLDSCPVCQTPKKASIEALIS